MVIDPVDMWQTKIENKIASYVHDIYFRRQTFLMQCLHSQFSFPSATFYLILHYFRLDLMLLVRVCRIRDRYRKGV